MLSSNLLYTSVEVSYINAHIQSEADIDKNSRNKYAFLQRTRIKLIVLKRSINYKEKWRAKKGFSTKGELDVTDFCT